MKYRIRWFASRTGKSGYGTGEYSRNEADRIARDNNLADKVGVVHTVEVVPVKNDKGQ